MIRRRFEGFSTSSNISLICPAHRRFDNFSAFDGILAALDRLSLFAPTSAAGNGQANEGEYWSVGCLMSIEC